MLPLGYQLSTFAMSELNVDKLLDNALISIRLGMEDFQRSKAPANDGGDPTRALAAVRNLFAGVLLLFKYKIASSVDDPEEAGKLIFNPPEVLPYPDGDGGIDWKPSGRFRRTTIDVATIKKRFEAFEVEVDWSTIDKLQECRNHLEHLHPANTLGEVSGFVAELFPLLRHFVESHLERAPVDVLGASWQIMLEHHQFFAETRRVCEAAWAEAGVPDEMGNWLNESRCEGCSSSLIRPNPEDLDAGERVSVSDTDFRYSCVACGNEGLIAPVMIAALNNAHDYDHRYGGEPGVETCDACGRDTFLVSEQHCLWCTEGLQYLKCRACGEALRQDDQNNGGLCGYHSHLFEKAMRDD